ncbi:MAG: biotin/lipoate A/B protein ligase family protein [Planctomycetales bacterium]
MIDPAPGSGSWNMGVDALLLESAVESEVCSLRFYGWDQPTLSLGYFQESNPGAIPDELADLPVVRRLSGGGAIVHDQELTYSCALPARHPLSSAPRELYTHVHKLVMGVLAGFGIAAQLRGEGSPEKAAEFLCFGRGDDFDLVVQGHKVLGSAQRRRKGAILQHGSLVLRGSRRTPQLPGLWDLTQKRLLPLELADQLSQAIGSLLASHLRLAQLTPAESRHVMASVQSREG